MKTIFAFGRFNPPTIAHYNMVKTIADIAAAEQRDAYVFVSNTVDSNKNPLNPGEKIELISRSFPRVIFSKQAKNPFDALELLSKEYNDITVVCGADRLSSYSTMHKYKDDLNLQHLQILEYGSRNQQGDLSEVSASLLRKYAVENDLESYLKFAYPCDKRIAVTTFATLQQRLTLKYGKQGA